MDFVKGNIPLTDHTEEVSHGRWQWGGGIGTTAMSEGDKRRTDENEGCSGTRTFGNHMTAVQCSR